MGNDNFSSGDPATFCEQVCLAILFLHCNALSDLVDHCCQLCSCTLQFGGCHPLLEGQMGHEFEWNYVWWQVLVQAAPVWSTDTLWPAKEHRIASWRDQRHVLWHSSNGSVKDWIIPWDSVVLWTTRWSAKSLATGKWKCMCTYVYHLPIP